MRSTPPGKLGMPGDGRQACRAPGQSMIGGVIPAPSGVSPVVCLLSGTMMWQCSPGNGGMLYMAVPSRVPRVCHAEVLHACHAEVLHANLAECAEGAAC
jgi:hypothetical protein